MATASAGYGRIPFKEQIEFFRRKVALPSDSWTQLYSYGHDHGFVVAGANRDDLVTDFYQAVDKAISEGQSLQTWQRNFDSIVEKHGWDYNGSRGWRSKVIYETNLSTSFSAGRREQLLSMTKTHPYWMYVHSDTVEHPRQEHLALDGLVLRWDDPLWRTHFPPNGWGCMCSVRALTKRQAIAMGKVRDDGEPSQKAPPIKMREVIIGKDGPSPRKVTVPVGIDPGFEYAPGTTSRSGDWIGQRASTAMSTAPNLDDSKRWIPVLETGPAEYGRPDRMPMFTPPAQLAPRLGENESMISRVESVLGGRQRVFDVRGLPVSVDAAALGKHLESSPGRSEYLPWLPDLLTDPWEIWTNLYRDQVTGKYELRTRFIKAYQQDKNGRGLLAVAQGGAGFLESWTFIPARDIRYIQRQRVGKLWFGK